MPQATAPGAVQNLLERMKNSDKDFRFMATNDLMAELQKENLEWDDESEVKIIHQIIKLLKDKNGEVQNLAVKCLGHLIGKIKDDHRMIVIKSLCSMMKNETEETRDISSMALKTIVPEIPINKKMIDMVNNELIPNLLIAIGNADDVNVQLESLEILADLISRLGTRLSSFHDRIQQELIKQLSSDRSAVRKRSMNALSNLLASCSDDLFNSTISQLQQALSQYSQRSTSGDLPQFQDPAVTNTVKTLLQCVATIIRFAGHRSNMSQLKEIIPTICTFCELDDDELREYSLQAFESYVRRCPVNIIEALPEIIRICLTNITYDPNYNYNDDYDDNMDCDQMDVEEANGHGDDDDSDSLEDYSDDDDLSWKVRRASARCLEAIILAKRDSVEELFQTVGPILVTRFKEREESVKADIIQTFVSLLKQIRQLVQSSSLYSSSTHPMSEKLIQMVPVIVNKSNLLLKDKFLKTRQLSLNMFIEIINIIPNGLASYIQPILTGVLHSIVDKNSSTNMKMDAIMFLQELIKTHQPPIFYPHMDSLLPVVLNAVDDIFYRNSSEAISLLTQLITVIKPQTGEPIVGYEKYYPVIYQRIFDKMSQTGVDLEIKEKLITCMGRIMSTFGDLVHNHLPKILDIFFDRIDNETTRLTAIRALNELATSQTQIPLEKIYPRAFLTLVELLCKSSRQVRLSCLDCMQSLLDRYISQMDSDSTKVVLSHMPIIISDSDLYVSQLAFKMMSFLVDHDRFLYIEGITDDIICATLRLIRCPLLQGSALSAVLEFLAKAQDKLPAKWSHSILLKKLVEPIYEGQTLHEQAYHSAAKAIAVLSVGQEQRKIFATKSLIQDCKVFQANEMALTLILLSLGEIGKLTDLSSDDELTSVVLQAFDSHSEDVKSAASYTLGCLAVGNRFKFLPIILNEVNSKNARMYLALHSLREVISCGQLDEYESIWTLLMNNCACKEEGTRNVVSECLGKLTLLQPEVLLQRLIKQFKEDFPNNPLARSTIIAAIKFTISEQPKDFDQLLAQYIGEFLMGLQDSDIEVRRSALILFNSAAHNKPTLILGLLPSILPLLYQETKIKKHLIRQVDMGPFKHMVDDGLDSRKAAFECMYTLLDSCQTHLDMIEFLTHVEHGLNDDYDIKMLAYLMLSKLVLICPSQVMQRLEHILTPIAHVCRSKVKDTAVKQEHERQEELKRNSLKAFECLRSMPNADNNINITRFIEDIIRPDKRLTEMYALIQITTTLKSNDTSIKSC